ncbi:MAG TPA: putative metal-dependent hydrolase [Blastocatellia bacterium]|nr:putative metal-dependent hydrolase [Blastocatellia bacterium]
MNAAEELRFPVGDFVIDPAVTDEKRRGWIAEMAQAPANLRAALAELSNDQLDTYYREGGWTLRQVVHHLADAHINGFVRFKLALTENNPLVKTFEEALWAETIDGREAPVELSLKLLEALHERWVILLNSLRESDFTHRFSHPQRGAMTIDQAIQLYAWHGVHHIAHVTGLRKRKGW